MGTYLENHPSGGLMGGVPGRLVRQLLKVSKTSYEVRIVETLYKNIFLATLVNGQFQELLIPKRTFNVRKVMTWLLCFRLG